MRGAGGGGGGGGAVRAHVATLDSVTCVCVRGCEHVW